MKSTPLVESFIINRDLCLVYHLAEKELERHRRAQHFLTEKDSCCTSNPFYSQISDLPKTKTKKSFVFHSLHISLSLFCLRSQCFQWKTSSTYPSLGYTEGKDSVSFHITQMKIKNPNPQTKKK